MMMLLTLSQRCNKFDDEIVMLEKLSFLIFLVKKKEKEISKEKKLEAQCLNFEARWPSFQIKEKLETNGSKE